MMEKLRLTLVIAALSLVATALLPINAAAYTPTWTFMAVGSSAQWNSLGLAAGLDNAAGSGNAALCGEHHWTYNGTLNTSGIQVHDARSTSIPDQIGKVWVVWDDNFINQTGTSHVCMMVSLDSGAGVREYFANATFVVNNPSTMATTPDAGIVPYLPKDTTDGGLPTAVSSFINGYKVNVAVTDIRPEDAKFATIRALETPAGTRIPRDRFTGAGYGPGPVGTMIWSSQSATELDPEDYAILAGDVDPFTSAAPRVFQTVSSGAAPVLVLANQSDTASGGLGSGAFTDILRSALTGYLTGTYTLTRQMAYQNGYNGTALPAVYIHVWQRECISGTFNVIEYNVPLTWENYSTYNGAYQIGQETGIDPTQTQCSGKTPCSVQSGNPWYYCGTSYGSSCPAWTSSNTRGRVIGTGEMVSTTNSTSYPDSLGYAFWSYSAFSGKTNLKYLTVDGVDPLYASASANPNGVGVLPTCAAIPCAVLPFTNIKNGGYPIWSYYRWVYDYTDPTVFINGMLVYSRATVVDTLSDYVPDSLMQVFRSHFNQVVVTSNSNDQAPNNGFKSGVPETGGDMGGQILTIQSELDYIADTGAICSGGCQQTNMFQ